ncbi:MAG: hypothetical protein KBS68_07545 [Clostridiales bacterium]|nr:hypothetical protein [Candidatus Crickella merdequi]
MDKTLDNRKTLIKFFIIIAIAVAFKMIVHPAYDLTPAGVTYLAIFLGTVLCWIFVGSAWPTLLSMAALLMTGTLPIGTIGATGWGSMLVMSLICSMVVASKLQEFGVLRYIARWMISRKIVHGRPFVFAAVWSLAIFAVVGLSGGHVIAYLLFIPLAHDVCAEIGVKKGEKFYLMFILLTLWTGIIAESVFPFCSMTDLTGLGILAGMNLPMSTVQYLVRSIVPGIIVPVLISQLVIRFMLKPDTSLFDNYDDAAKRAELKQETICTEGKIAITFFLLWILFGGLLPGLSALGAISAWASSVGIAGFNFFMVGVLCIIQVKGEPIVSAKDAAKVPWTIIIFMSGIMTFSATIGSEDFGIVPTVTKLLFPIATKLSLPAVIIVGAIVVTVLSNFISNTVTCVIGISVFIPLILQMGASNSLAYSVGTMIIMLCSAACLTPSATVGTPMIMGPEASMKEMFKYSLAFIIGDLVLITLLYSTVIPQIMG